MDSGIYIAFLLGVDRNSATFGTYTRYIGAEDDNAESRVLSILSAEMLNDVFYEVDREAFKILDWPHLYRWLGRDIGTWATFSKKSASCLVPHWFSDSVNFICRRVVANGPFVDVNSQAISDEQLIKIRDLTGAVDSRRGRSYASQFFDNLVLTTRPIFKN